MTAILQPYSRVFGADGHAYMKARGRKIVPYNPDVPVLVKRSVLTGFKVMTNGIGGPVDPGDPDVLEDRDTLLKPFYARLGTVGSPYSKRGPTKAQVGPRVPYSKLKEYNPATTTNLNITTPVVWDKMIIHGRITVTGAGQITATDCAFDGPDNPTGSWITGETAIIDFNAAGSTTNSVIKDCALYAHIPNPRLNAVKGARHTLERCHIFWVTDGAGPYSNGTYHTAFNMMGCRVENLIYWPGQYYANQSPAYWDGGAYSAAGTSTIARSAADGKVTGAYDNVHSDGNHTDCIEIHNGFGTLAYNSGTDTWSGDGIHIWGNALICNDGWGQGNPSTLDIPIPNLGRGDNPTRGLPGGGQKPGVNNYVGAAFTKGLAGTSPTQYAARGVSIYIGHVTGSAFETATTVVVHGNYINGGNMGMQEQKKALPFIQFVFYDNVFGPDYYAWASTNDRDMYPVRINDYATANAMPDFVSGPVRIANHPKTGTPPFGTGGNNIWYDPGNKFPGRNGTALGLGSSTVPGLRVI